MFNAVGVRWRLILVVAAVASASVPPLAAEQLLDPTRPLDYSSGHSEPPLELHSILIAKGRRIAVINGQQAAEREKIGDIHVLRILPNRVIVERNGRRIELKLRSALTQNKAG